MHLKNVDFINIHASIFIIHTAYFIRAKLRPNWQCFVCIWIVECSFSGTCTPWSWTLAVDRSFCCQLSSHSKLPSTTSSTSLLTIVYSQARWPWKCKSDPGTSLLKILQCLYLTQRRNCNLCHNLNTLQDPMSPPWHDP